MYIINKCPCGKCIYYDPVIYKDEGFGRYGWCSKLSLYPAEEQERVFPPKVRRARKGWPAEPFIVKNTDVYPHCIDVKEGVTMNKKNLDDMAKRFLGTNNVHTVTGQKANVQKQQEIQEHFLLEEACRFGDILVRYIIAHRKLSKMQRTWGFGLTLFCLREDYPHGIDDFDELIDQGGESLTLNEQNITEKDHIEELAAFNETEQQEAAKFAEVVSKYIETKKHQLGLSNTQAVYGMGRAFHNLRLGYPLKEGGTAAFDELFIRANSYYRKFK